MNRAAGRFLEDSSGRSALAGRQDGCLATGSSRVNSYDGGSYDGGQKSNSQPKLELCGHFKIVQKLRHYLYSIQHFLLDMDATVKCDQSIGEAKVAVEHKGLLCPEWRAVPAHEKKAAIGPVHGE